MIDSDPIKFSIGRLYSWKMQHEALMERRQEGTSYTEELLSAELQPFLNEPPGARQIALDRPRGWEYLLTIELLRPKLNGVFRELTDCEADLILFPSSAFSIQEFGARLQELISDMERGGAALSTLINSRLPEACGQLDKPGDPLAILRTCNQLEETCRFLLNIEARTRSLVWPEALKHLRKDLLGWNCHNILLMQQIVDGLSDAVEEALALDQGYDGPPIVRKIHLALTLPKQYERFFEKLSALDFEQIIFSESYM
ncbi:hypothetical protein IQ260_21295 [Leptolyngbya cf. ectocarpi LEGE 11479]|uniref:Uncharacterized protein n=1 Tax=Leptolyngbya cf. ectocarpi LEGE 11479 TaxID=1828722 RepID=A0A929F8A5_LEPEC|nr:hypothetical protein [Leptolyngbya ectocarpi]MBE9069185.1 hypothetical protein [Leptolyngbya cf. ectocarpi LEGE 11479]